MNLGPYLQDEMILMERKKRRVGQKRMNSMTWWGSKTENKKIPIKITVNTQ
jgi:hypothetical protein